MTAKEETPIRNESNLKWLLHLLGTIVISWLLWVSHQIVDLGRIVTGLEVKVFGSLAEAEKQLDKDDRESEATPNLFHFLERHGP